MTYITIGLHNHILNKEILRKSLSHIYQNYYIQSLKNYYISLINSINNNNSKLHSFYKEMKYLCHEGEFLKSIYSGETLLIKLKHILISYHRFLLLKIPPVYTGYEIEISTIMLRYIKLKKTYLFRQLEDFKNIKNKNKRIHSNEIINNNVKIYEKSTDSISIDVDIKNNDKFILSFYDDENEIEERTKITHFSKKENKEFTIFDENNDNDQSILYLVKNITKMNFNKIYKNIKESFGITSKYNIKKKTLKWGKRRSMFIQTSSSGFFDRFKNKQNSIGIYKNRKNINLNEINEIQTSKKKEITNLKCKLNKNNIFGFHPSANILTSKYKNFSFFDKIKENKNNLENIFNSWNKCNLNYFFDKNWNMANNVFIRGNNIKILVGNKNIFNKKRSNFMTRDINKCILNRQLDIRNNKEHKKILNGIFIGTQRDLFNIHIKSNNNDLLGKKNAKKTKKFHIINSNSELFNNQRNNKNKNKAIYFSLPNRK